VIYRSSYYTRVGDPIEQPVPFSHAHHVGGLGLDCRLCHAAVTTSAYAGMPTTKTCMRCHVRIWNDSAMLAPVRDSYRSGKPLVWNRVYDLPDFVYFNHSIPVAKGVACAQCHGALDTMPLTQKAETLTMRFCLDCHRNPEPRRGAPEAVFSTASARASGHPRLPLDRSPQRLMECGTCHR
jgi:hypothetical protein